MEDVRLVTLDDLKEYYDKDLIKVVTDYMLTHEGSTMTLFVTLGSFLGMQAAHVSESEEGLDVTLLMICKIMKNAAEFKFKKKPNEPASGIQH
jgi:hypothetical protein